MNSAPAALPPADDDRRSVVVSALIFALGTGFSRILGLIRDMLTARYFSDDVRDAFLNAFRLPNLFRRIFGEGSLSVSFIPVFTEILRGRVSGSDEAEVRAKTLIAGVFTVLLSLTVTISLLAIIFMDEIMLVLLNGQTYMSVPGKFALTVRLGRIMFGFLILIGLYGFFMAILNSLRKFALTALAPCLFNVAMISAALISPRVSLPAMALAISVVVGGLFQMLILVPALVKQGYFPRLGIDLTNGDLLRVLKAVLPSAFGLSILQITALVNMRFAADLPSGSHSYLYLADRILELPLSLFVVSIGSALLPTLTRFYAEQDRGAMAETINHYIRLIVFVAWPAALGMFVLAQPITEVLFLGREFKYDDALATASVIRVYSAAVVFSAGVRILAQGFYAIQNTWFPALAGAVALFSHVVFAFVLTRHFGLMGLASASVCSAFVNLMMLGAAYNSWVGSLHIKRLLQSFGRFAVCGLAMVMSLQCYAPAHQFLVGRVRGSKIISLAGVIILAISAYFAVAHVLKVAEYRETLSTFRARLNLHLASRRARSSK